MKEERFEVLVPRDRMRGDRVTVKVVDANNNEQTAAIVIGAMGKKR
jgi:hypothetical protein